MTLHALFPTRVYAGALQRRGSGALNRQLLKECLQLRADDLAGRRWSKRNYPGGYTSYASAHRLQLMSPTFRHLQRLLDPHVAQFAAAVEWDLAGRRLEMTDCWINVMPKGAAHGLHLHPLSTVSGTYYVRVAKGSPGLKFEDPRLERFMAAPPRKLAARRESQPWITFPAAPGRLLLFESWLRHEVAANLIDPPRISVSFNYNWF
jgi:uncharacterized protein (TIGR02466 family)